MTAAGARIDNAINWGFVSQLALAALALLSLAVLAWILWDIWKETQ